MAAEEQIIVKDKNKALFKLRGLPRIYYINLDDQIDRRKYMEDQFNYWEIEKFERISAHDGRGDNDLGEWLKGTYPKGMSSGEVGCTISHLKAIKHWLDNTSENEEMLLVMEDDCDISCALNWGFTWREFQSNLPYHFDVVQLAIINPGELHVKMHLRFVNDFSTACYLIRRHHAEKLVKLHCRGDKYKIDQDIKPRAVADDLIYNSGLTFAIPLFLYKIEMGSSIHGSHVDVFHKSSHQGLWDFWRKQAPQIEKWDKFFKYDPYFGTLPPGILERQWKEKYLKKPPEPTKINSN